MEKILIYDANNNRVEIDVVKYFQYKYTNYLLYTANETDEKGFVKLYVVKILKELGSTISYNLTDDNDWLNFQNIIKTIIKEIKDNKEKSFKNLETNLLTDLKAENARSFKLKPELVELLANDAEPSNMTEEAYNESVSIPSAVPISELVQPDAMQPAPEISSINEVVDNVETIKYKEMYLQMKQEKENLDSIVANILGELTEYKVKFGELNIAPTPIDTIQRPAQVPIGEDDYQNLYLNMEYQKKVLDLIISDMLGELTEYKVKFGEIGV